MIVTVGDTDFTAVGAPSNTPGTIFTLTGTPAGTGTVVQEGFFGTVAVGHRALANNTTDNNWNGTRNVAIGHRALESNTLGSDNVAIGTLSTNHSTTSGYNVAVGSYSLYTHQSGVGYNIAIGAYTNFNSTTGTSNTTVGEEGMYSITTGSYNTAIGRTALHNTTTGSRNVAIGNAAGHSLTTGSDNTLIGGYTGVAGMAGNVVLSTGDGTVRLQHDGMNWTSATPISTTGLILPSTTSTITLNGSVGTTGQVLTSAGAGATPTWSKPYVALTGDTMAGSLYAQQSDHFFTWLAGSGADTAGFTCLRSDKTTTAGSVGVAGTDGAESYTYIGSGSSPSTTGVKVNSSGTLYNTMTGGSWVNWNSSRSSLTQVNCALADAAYMGMRWTTTGGTSFAAIDADPNTTVGTSTLLRFHVGTLTGAFGVDGSGNATAAGNVTAYSDAKLKKDLEVIPNALSKVMQLTGYTYTRIDTEQRQTGLIAQDVQAVLPEAVSQTKDDILTLAYGNLVGLLVEAIKELKAEIEELKK
jgi:hypothetical protein